MTIHTVCYVNRSEVFNLLPNVWEDVAETISNQCSWGDNSHSLVPAAKLSEWVAEIKRAHVDACLPDPFKDEQDYQIVIDDLNALPKNTFVDMEN